METATASMRATYADEDTGTVTETTTKVTVERITTKTNARTNERAADWNERVREEKVRVVVSQTNYGVEEARRVLETHEWDCKAAIRAYLHDGRGAPEAGQAAPKSTNQQIFSSIRKMMDEASRTYYANREKQTR